MRVSPAQLDEILHPILDPASEKKAKVMAQGLPASPGGAVGTLVFTPEDAVKAAADFITKSNEEDGVGDFLSTRLLKNK